MNKKGLTLLELLAVIVVLAVIILIAIPILLNVVEKARLGSLKDSAYGLVDEANLYYMQHHPNENLRFDINDGVISSNDTTKLLSYKGSIENGSIILTSYGKVAICINDGKFAAYKNLSDKEVTINNEKNCSIPEGNTIIYLEGTATITELNNQELTAVVQELQHEVAELKKGVNPIGTIIAVSHNSIPDGYLSCNGQAVSRTEYSALFDLIGTTYGAGDGSTTFNLPDLRGEFLRGSGTNSHTNQGNGAGIGIHQDATGIPYTYSYINNNQTTSGISMRSSSDASDEYNTPTNIDSGLKGSKIAKYVYYQGTPGNASSDKTYKFFTRPTNTSVLYAIRAK